MPQGAGFDGNRRAGGNPNGHDANGGGVGPHGGAPGYRGGFYGGNFGQGGTNSGGPRRQQGTIATRPGTWGNIGTALGFMGATGPFRAAGMALAGVDPYSGPVGHTGWSGADTPGSMLGTLQPGLMQPQAPMAPGQMVPGPMQPPPQQPQIPPQLQQTQVPGRFLGVAPGYGVNIPGYGYL
jgi:hypothetical protein